MSDPESDKESVGFIIYTSDGTITRTGSCPRWMVESQYVFPGESVMEGDADDRIHWVNNGAVRDKNDFSVTVSKTTIAADGVDQAVIAGIPQGTKVIWPGGMETVNDGQIEFSTDEPGTTDFLLTHGRHKQLTISITAE